MDLRNQEKFQNQLRTYLKGYKQKSDITSEDLAEELGYTINVCRALEGFKPYPKFINSLRFLQKLAILEKKTLSDFISYLERNSRTKAGTGIFKRELYRWELVVLDTLDILPLVTRKQFTEHLKSFLEEFRLTRRDDKARSNLITSLELFMAISSLKSSDRDLLSQMVKRMSG